MTEQEKATRRLHHAAVTLAMMCARQTVKDAIRRQGIRKLSLVPSAEITAMAKVYLAAHRDALMGEARTTVEQWMADGFFGKRAQREWLRANVMQNVQSLEHCSDKTISVQHSCVN